jgi:nucleotide-binding universal stress UspA family protein
VESGRGRGKVVKRATILFADDGSDAADIAWEWICAQDWAGWHVDCLYVEELAVPTFSVDPDAETPKPWDPPEPMQRQAPASCGLGSVEYLKALGDPRVVLYKVPPPDVLVLGKGRIETAMAALLGSTARYLMESPPAPVIIAKTASEVRKVLVCSDGSIHSNAALEAFVGLPWAGRCDVDVVYVEQSRVSSAAVKDSVTAVVEAALPELSWQFESIRGRPKEVLVKRLASSKEYDLVVAGTRGYSTLPRPHLGSVTHALAHRAQVNLLVSHAR